MYVYVGGAVMAYMYIYADALLQPHLTSNYHTIITVQPNITQVQAVLASCRVLCY